MQKAVLFTLAGIAGIAGIALLMIEQGWAISVLWAWFIVPLGVQALSIPAAIGVGITISMMHVKKGNKEDGEWYETIGFAVLKPLLAVGIGWIVKQFM